MRKVTCGECGKRYDFDADDFCPRCGAFNRPATAARRSEGISEANHHDSFLHKELHEENRERRGSELAHGVHRGPAGEIETQTYQEEQPKLRGESHRSQEELEQDLSPKRSAEVGAAAFIRIVGYIIVGIVLLNLLASLFRF